MSEGGSKIYWRAHPHDRPFSVEDAKSREWATDHEHDEGYSAFEHPHELVGYFHPGERMEGAHSDSHVRSFSGHQVGEGMDGEPLVRPDMKHVQQHSWADLHRLVGHDRVRDIEHRNGWTGEHDLGDFGQREDWDPPHKTAAGDGGLGDLTYKDDHRHQTGPGHVTYHVEVEHGRRREDAVAPEHGPVTPAYLQPADKSYVQIAVHPHGKTMDEMDQEAHKSAYDMASATSPHDMVTKTRILHVEAKTAHVLTDWQPSERIFAPTKKTLDPRLFDAHKQMHPQVRLAIMKMAEAFLSQYSHDWQSWARIYLAGSQASLWWGNNDFDILVGIQFDTYRASTGSTLSDDEIKDLLNTHFREAWNDEQWHPPFDPDNEWHLTGYVNPNSWDIRRIKPYAAYEVVSGTWFVEPPEEPGGHQFAPSEWYLFEGYAEEIRAAAELPEPHRSTRLNQIWSWLHKDRGRAFGPNGSGVFDRGNAVEKYLDQAGLWDVLVQARFPKQGAARRKVLYRSDQVGMTLCPSCWKREPGSEEDGWHAVHNDHPSLHEDIAVCSDCGKTIVNRVPKEAALRPDVKFTDLGREHIDGGTHTHLRKRHEEVRTPEEVKTLPIDQVHPGQSVVDRDDEYQRDPEHDEKHPPRASVLPNGHYQLHDGHHRFADALARGDSHFTVKTMTHGHGECRAKRQGESCSFDWFMEDAHKRMGKTAMTEDDHEHWESEHGSMDRYKPRTWHEDLQEAFDMQRVHEDLQEDEHWSGGRGEEEHARENGYQRSKITDFRKHYRERVSTKESGYYAQDAEAAEGPEARVAGKGKPRSAPARRQGDEGTGGGGSGAGESRGAQQEVGSVGRGFGTGNSHGDYSVHPKVDKDMASLDKPIRKKAADLILQLSGGEKHSSTHPLPKTLPGWHSTHVNSGTLIIHQTNEDGTLHVGGVFKQHAYDQAERRLGYLAQEVYA